MEPLNRYCAAAGACSVVDLSGQGTQEAFGVLREITSSHTSPFVNTESLDAYVSSDSSEDRGAIAAEWLSQMEETSAEQDARYVRAGNAIRVLRRAMGISFCVTLAGLLLGVYLLLTGHAPAWVGIPVACGMPLILFVLTFRLPARRRAALEAEKVR